MFLKQIETRPPEGMMSIAFKKLRETGHAVPEIMHLFRFKKRSTDHLVRFTEEVLRGPSPLSRGLRELIGAYVSTRNNCRFCRSAHVAVAARLLGKELVDEVLLDMENSRLDERHKELFRYIQKLAENPAEIDAPDILKLKQAGWSEEEIYDALTVASLFKFYNTWNNGSGVQAMSPADYAHSGERIMTFGYCMDFSLKGVLKIMWLGRKEIKLADIKGLIKSLWPARQEAKYAPTPARDIASSRI
ncbi:MAG: carboxymuconolactone decarboxylase family protein [Verrucomicrobia bacterium]|nr:carboxymuconolactone decarboxylase family protein [Verrucomicrobiota bacterium]